MQRFWIYKSFLYAKILNLEDIFMSEKCGLTSHFYITEKCGLTSHFYITEKVHLHAIFIAENTVVKKFPKHQPLTLLGKTSSDSDSKRRCTKTVFFLSSNSN
jgi:hypothetical protein